MREERLAEAAALARAEGDLGTASALFERACDWVGAAETALQGADPGRALTLAALGGRDEVAQVALDAMRTAATPAAIAQVADGLRQRAQFAWAARAYEAARATEEAADAWQRAGDRVRAARLLEGEDGQGAARAARLLEAGLRQDSGRADLLLALGALMLRCGKPTPALRALQRVPDAAPEKREALLLSMRALTDLGMTDAKAELAAELAALGEHPLPDSSVERGSTGPRAAGAPAGAARLYGRYEVVREVSSTATARLLECRDVIRDERVAVKLFSAQSEATLGGGRDALARFAREARVLAQLAHPNIVPLREVLEQGPALVLDWMPGGTLEDHLATESFTPARAVDIACAILAALGEAHRLGVVHRDIKPANILFDAAGTPRLSDFGVAHLGDLSVTATAGSFGSLAYMSPEQREGRPATAQSDLFAMGVVLLEMLTGSRTLPGNAAGPSLAAIHRHLDARHDAALATLLARDPAARPGDAFNAARALSALPWPAEHDAERGAAPHHTRAAHTSTHPAPMRLELPDPLAGGAPRAARDRWLERPVTCVPLTPRALARAGAFARVSHRALQPILRVDRDAGAIWLGVPRGAALARPLSREERATLETAVMLLHAEGVVHGAIGHETVRVDGTTPVLLFAREGGGEREDDGDATAETDRLALSRL